MVGTTGRIDSESPSAEPFKRASGDFPPILKGIKCDMGSVAEWKKPRFAVCERYHANGTGNQDIPASERLVCAECEKVIREEEKIRYGMERQKTRHLVV